MKALFFAKPIEYRLETEAENLTQGESFSGGFTAVNRGGELLKGRTLTVALAYAEFKKLKENPAEAFEVMQRLTLAQSVALKPGKEAHKEWSIELPPDCPVTSTAGSLFLLYGGDVDAPGEYGMLDLRVGLEPALEAFIETVENHFSFMAGSPKYVDGYTETALKPPASYPTLERMLVLMRLRDEVLELVYHCKKKSFDRGATTGVGSKTIEIERTYPASQVLVGGKRPNRNLFRAEFQSVLEEIVPSILQEKS